MSDVTRALQVSAETFTGEVDKIVAQAGALVASSPESTRADLEQLLRRIEQLPGDTTTLVVVGETKTGKSSLVNALVGRPGLSPVEADVATATYVVLQHGDEDAAWVRPEDTRRADGSLARERVPLDGVSAWTTVEGIAANPRLQRTIDGRPFQMPNPVEITIDSPILEGFAIIDTPGVGGLVGDHADVTRTAIRIATAMLFVTDITSPLTAGEVDFLDEVANWVGEVVIAVNMADRLVASSRERALEDLRAKIAERLPRYSQCSLVAVSAKRAESAFAGDLPGDARAQLRALSGLDELERVLEERVVQWGAILAQCVRLQVVRDVAATLANAQAARVVTLGAAGGARTAKNVSDDQDNLGHQVLDVQAEINHELATLQTTVDEHIDAAARALRAHHDAQATNGAKKISELEPEVARDLEVLGQQVTDLVSSGLDACVKPRLGEEVGDPLFAMALAKAAAEASADSRIRDVTDPEKLTLGRDAALTSSLDAYSGIVGSWVDKVLSQVGGVQLGAGAASALVLGPIGVLLAVGVLGMNIVVRRRALNTEHVQAWVRDRLDLGVHEIQTAVAARLREATFLLDSAVRQWQKLRLDQLRDEMFSLQSSGQQVAQELVGAGNAQAAALALGKAATEMLAEAGHPALGPAPSDA